MKTKLLYVIIVIIVMPLATLNAVAQTNMGTVGNAITATQFEQKGDMLYIKFKFNIDDIKLKSKQELSYTPIISSPTKSVILPKITLRGRNNNKMHIRKMALMNNNQRADYQLASPLYANIKAFGDSVDNLNYQHTLPYEDWMADSKLIMKSDMYSSGQISDRKSWTLKNITLEPKPVVKAIVPVVPIVEKEQTPVISPVKIEKESESITSFAKEMSAKYPFVSLISNYASDMKTIYSPKENEYLRIYFPRDISAIDDAYMRNSEELRSLRNAISELQNLDKYKIAKVLILGFASIDGSNISYDLLTLRRIESVNNYIYNNTRINSSLLEIYNGTENWDGLREMVVESSMMDKAVVLYVIDNTFGLEETIRQIKALNNGNTYKYMKDHFFPKLRCAYVKVYFDKK